MNLIKLFKLRFSLGRDIRFFQPADSTLKRKQPVYACALVYLLYFKPCHFRAQLRKLVSGSYYNLVKLFLNHRANIG